MSKIEKIHKVVQKLTELDVEILRIYDDLDVGECGMIMMKLQQFEEWWNKMMWDKYKTLLNKTRENEKRIEELSDEK